MPEVVLPMTVSTRYPIKTKSGLLVGWADIFLHSEPRKAEMSEYPTIKMPLSLDSDLSLEKQVFPTIKAFFSYFFPPSPPVFFPSYPPPPPPPP